MTPSSACCVGFLGCYVFTAVLSFNVMTTVGVEPWKAARYAAVWPSTMMALSQAIVEDKRDEKRERRPANWRSAYLGG